MEKKINEAAEKYAENKLMEKAQGYARKYWTNYLGCATSSFLAGVKSDAAKEYWQAQFQQTQNNVWVKASERLPEKDISKDVIGKSKTGRIDIYSYDSMMDFFRPYKHEADELYEWLDETHKIQTISEEEIKALAEKEVREDSILSVVQSFSWKELFGYGQDKFIKGFKSCLNYKK